LGEALDAQPGGSSPLGAQPGEDRAPEPIGGDPASGGTGAGGGAGAGSAAAASGDGFTPIEDENDLPF
jgi:hypothetical protein